MVDGPVLGRLVRTSPVSMELRSGSTVLGRCWTGSDFVWHAQIAGGSPLDLVTVSDTDTDDMDVLMFDHSLNIISSLHSLASGSIVLTDASDHVSAVIRPDGRGGLKVSSPNRGDLMLAGRGNGGSLDVLITEAGCEKPLGVMLALLSSLEVHSLGPLFSSSS